MGAGKSAEGDSVTWQKHISLKWHGLTLTSAEWRSGGQHKEMHNNQETTDDDDDAHDNDDEEWQFKLVYFCVTGVIILKTFTTQIYRL